eukprot:scaffold676_cov273-Pinguiococcus_pyrenoidosus.AAC.16
MPSLYISDACGRQKHSRTLTARTALSAKRAQSAKLDFCAETVRVRGDKPFSGRTALRPKRNGKRLRMLERAQASPPRFCPSGPPESLQRLRLGGKELRCTSLGRRFGAQTHSRAAAKLRKRSPFTSEEPILAGTGAAAEALGATKKCAPDLRGLCVLLVEDIAAQIARLGRFAMAG